MVHSMPHLCHAAYGTNSLQEFLRGSSNKRVWQTTCVRPDALPAKVLNTVTFAITAVQIVLIRVPIVTPQIEVLP